MSVEIIKKRRLNMVIGITEVVTIKSLQVEGNRYWTFVN
ncbi:MAG: hypothetical protein K0R26_1467 [Bacteroidota bacterium]|jgi:hypothetical protein|nr:hypothetical protein [Bacteroidota bacterium]